MRKCSFLVLLAWGADLLDEFFDALPSHLHLGSFTHLGSLLRSTYKPLRILRNSLLLRGSPFTVFACFHTLCSLLHDLLAFRRCARRDGICLLLHAVLAFTVFACFHTLCSLLHDLLAFTRRARFHRMSLLLRAVVVFTRFACFYTLSLLSLAGRPHLSRGARKGGTLVRPEKQRFFQKRALQFKGRKGGEFLRKASFGPKIDIVHGGVFEKRFSISLRPRKIAKIAILIIKTRGGVKKNRALSLGPIDWKITSTNCSDRTLFKTLGGGPKAERLCKDGEARYAKMVLLLLI